MTTARRSSAPCRMRCSDPPRRADRRGTLSPHGYSRISSSGVLSSRMSRMRRSSVRIVHGAGSGKFSGKKKPPGGWRFLGSRCDLFSSSATVPPAMAGRSSTSKGRDGCATHCGYQIAQGLRRVQCTFWRGLARAHSESCTCTYAASAFSRRVCSRSDAPAGRGSPIAQTMTGLDGRSVTTDAASPAR